MKMPSLIKNCRDIITHLFDSQITTENPLFQTKWSLLGNLWREENTTSILKCHGYRLNFDEFVKSPQGCHSRDGGSPEVVDFPGFPPSREWRKRMIFDFLRDHQFWCGRKKAQNPQKKGAWNVVKSGSYKQDKIEIGLFTSLSIVKRDILSFSVYLTWNAGSNRILNANLGQLPRMMRYRFMFAFQ